MVRVGPLILSKGPTVRRNLAKTEFAVIPGLFSSEKDFVMCVQSHEKGPPSTGARGIDPNLLYTLVGFQTAAGIAHSLRRREQDHSVKLETSYVGR